MDEELDQVEFRKKNLKGLKEKGISPYPYRFERSHLSGELKEDFERLEGKKVSVAGRIRAMRSHGKSTFMDIQDSSGTIQIYLKSDTLKEDYEIVSLLNIGDFLGVKGEVMKTRMGEVTIWVKDLTVLSKSLHPLPEKWHGLSDREERYRKRYLDLIANEESFRVFKKRSEIIRAIRSFLDERGFIEVDTPILQPEYGGGFAKPFVTRQESIKKDLYLRIADELYLKRLIIGGMEKVYEIGRDFRNEGLDRLHNPEFTMLELYQAYADYKDMMELVESLFDYLLDRFIGSKTIQYQGMTISFEEGWCQISFYEALSDKTGIDFKPLSFEEAQSYALKLDVNIEGLYTKGKILDAVFSKKVEPIYAPTFVKDYPRDISPLAKDKRDEKGIVERFEPFLCGMEIGNAYSELNDPVEQRRRFEYQAELRKKGDQETESLDEDFLSAMSYGMPPTGGLGLGIDRIIMILLDQPSIRDVILFPLLR